MKIPQFKVRRIDEEIQARRVDSFVPPPPNNKIHEENRRYCPLLRQAGWNCMRCRREKPKLWDMCHRMLVWTERVRR